MKKLATRILLLVSLLLLPACKPASTKILFIGNSFTYYNGGLNNQLEQMDDSTSAAAVVFGGYTLADHWEAGQAWDSIRKGGWDYVVLQEQSQRPVLDPNGFLNSVRDFDVMIHAAGAETILLETWERPDSIQQGVTTENLSEAYRNTAELLDIKVAPAGQAFALARRERPDLVLYTDDGHPTVYGTYLTACVIYGTIFEKSPVGVTYADKSIPDDVRDFLQKTAAEALGY